MSPPHQPPLAFFRSLPQPCDPPPTEVRNIKGNISEGDKQLNVNVLAHFVSGGKQFGVGVGRGVRLVEIWIGDGVGGGESGMEVEVGKAKEARTVCEIVVTEEMANLFGVLHGACAAYIVDLCSSVPLIALGIANGLDYSGMSQSMHLIWHDAAKVGTTLKVVGTNVSVGGRIMAARCEIRDKATDRLFVSAVHTKIHPGAKRKSTVKL
ncbi:hypothetical protein JAAARDRAFT_117989 [Jaapia argillacea MUCL 33604]|uniref:Thioesterase domain-containing protein n=1 Tax=Jaapia argillacea MUCL 33604 TaxID=933084 RepID=A0A067QN48_9AGAM|nr:hypothetical protein JAAARDRAFT_117989 [Jaapia argillacea MUCL 33604]